MTILSNPACLLLLTLFSISCNGQTNAPPQEKVNQPQTIKERTSRLVKTQGTNRYANVYCGLMDKSGNLWFGTTGEGVYRYDAHPDGHGKYFTQFTVQDGLTDNWVYAVMEDKDGCIWFGTAKGLCRYDGKEFMHVPINENFSADVSNSTYYTDRSTKNSVWSMLQDKSGKLWFGTGSGVYCYENKIFTRFLYNEHVINKNGLHLKMIDRILEDRNGNIWFASGMPPGMEGLCRYDIHGSLVSFNPGGEKWIRYVLEDQEGNLLVGTRHQGVWRYDGKDFTRFPVAENMAIAAFIDNTGNYWFGGGENDNGYGGNGGIWRYNARLNDSVGQGESFTNFTTKDGMGDYAVYCFLQDNKGNLWIGTRNTGLYRYDGKTFTSFSE